MLPAVPAPPFPPVSVVPAPHPAPVGPRRAAFPPAAVCGIEVGSLRTPAYHADVLREGFIVAP